MWITYLLSSSSPWLTLMTVQFFIPFSKSLAKIVKENYCNTWGSTDAVAYLRMIRCRSGDPCLKLEHIITMTILFWIKAICRDWPLQVFLAVYRPDVNYDIIYVYKRTTYSLNWLTAQLNERIQQIWCCTEVALFLFNFWYEERGHVKSCAAIALVNVDFMWRKKTHKLWHIIKTLFTEEPHTACTYKAQWKNARNLILYGDRRPPVWLLHLLIRRKKDIAKAVQLWQW